MLYESIYGFRRSVVSHSDFLDLDCSYPCTGLVSIYYQDAINSHLKISTSIFKGSVLKVTLINSTRHILRFQTLSHQVDGIQLLLLNIKALQRYILETV